MSCVLAENDVLTDKTYYQDTYCPWYYPGCTVVREVTRMLYCRSIPNADKDRGSKYQKKCRSHFNTAPSGAEWSAMEGMECEIGALNRLQLRVVDSFTGLESRGFYFLAWGRRT